MREDEVSSVRAEIGAQSGRPPLELIQRPLEARVPRRGQFDIRSSAPLDLEVGELLANEELLQLRILLEIALLVAQTNEVERRHRDVDVAALEELLHVP